MTALGMADAMVAGTRGVPVPVHIERALRRAMELARRPPASPSTGVNGLTLLPSRSRTGLALTEFRTCQARLAASPSDADLRQALDDAAYTLCVLMGRRTVHDAVLGAEQHLNPHA
ncbi:DUF5133 domain-containing protein [Streptomyces sp. NPDC059499]|uniref:DUF5133 domain-containing protein n=1 Tax=Streptomyces sp. NPDC059499 TaxID=3346852 RepID=UPI0036A21C0A